MKFPKLCTMRGSRSKDIPVAMSTSSSQILALKYRYPRVVKEQDMPGGDVGRNAK